MHMLVYLITIKIRAPLNFAPLIYAPLIFAHPQILRPSNFRAPLFYCEFAVISFIRGIFSSPFNFRVFVVRELAPFNFCASQMGREFFFVGSFNQICFSSLNSTYNNLALRGSFSSLQIAPWDCTPPTNPFKSSSGYILEGLFSVVVSLLSQRALSLKISFPFQHSNWKKKQKSYQV